MKQEKKVSEKVVGKGEWKGRSLENYKKQQAARAKEKGCYEELLNCRTLTQARKLLSGMGTTEK